MKKNKLFPTLLMLFILGCSTHVKNGVYHTYYETGILKSVKNYNDGVLNGMCREYYEVGTIKHVINYRNNQVHGMHHTYYPNGALWTKEVYDNGIFIGRKEYDEEGIVIKEEGFN